MAKRLTDNQRQILKAAQMDIDKEVQWVYEEVKKARDLYKDEKDIKEKFENKNEEVNKRGICLAGDVVEMVSWKKRTHQEERNRYVRMTNLIAITNGYGHDEVHDMFLIAVKRFLMEDFEHPTDALLSNKEQRHARKRRKVEKKYGEKKEIKGNKSDEQKKIDSRLRKLKREAKKEGVTLEEYKKKYGYGDDGKKIKSSKKEEFNKNTQSNKSKNKKSKTKKSKKKNTNTDKGEKHVA